MEKNSGISKFSTAELKALRSRGESQTDLPKVRAKTADQLEQDIASDPDFKEVPADWYLAAQAVMPTPKKLLSLRLEGVMHFSSVVRPA